MTTARRIIVALPAFDEAASIGAVLVALAATRDALGCAIVAIVVDDGSRDRTAEVAASHGALLPVRLLRHALNEGLGATLRDGLLAALEEAAEDDVIVTMDADDTHAPAAIRAMLERIDAGCDVVIASRYCEGAVVVGVPSSRRLLSYGASLLFRAVHPISGVRDYTCGYRAYRAAVLRRAIDRYRQELITQEGFQCMVDILLKLSRMDLVFDEVPLVLRYDRKSGKSKMKVLRTILGTLRLLAVRRLGR